MNLERAIEIMHEVMPAEASTRIEEELGRLRREIELMMDERPNGFDGNGNPIKLGVS